MADSDPWARWVINGAYVHRPRPTRRDRELYTMCDQRLPSWSVVLTKKPQGLGKKGCGRCNEAVSRARRAHREITGLIERSRQPIAAPQPIPADGTVKERREAIKRDRELRAARAASFEVDKETRAAEQGRSIRAVSGGLPGLGNRHR